MQNINNFFGAEVQRRNNEWTRLRELLVPAVPPNLIDKIRYASEGDKILTIYADSAAWSAKLRFYETDIIKALKAAGRHLRSVQVRTIPDNAPGWRTNGLQES